MACTPGMAKAIASRADFGFINGICWGSLTDYPINQTSGKILDPGMSSKNPVKNYISGPTIRII